MRAGLLSVGPAPPVHILDDDTVRDLELAVLVDEMAGGAADARPGIEQVLRRLLLDPADIRHRQDVLADCRRHPAVVAELHALATEAVAAERAVGRTAYTGAGEPLLRRSVRVLRQLGDLLDRGRRILRADPADPAESAGFARLRATFAQFDGAYLREVDALLEPLRHDDGVVATVGLGAGNRPAGFVAHPPPGRRSGVPPALRRSRLRHVVTEAPGAREGMWSESRGLALLRDGVLAAEAEVVTAAAAHVTAFFAELRAELAFLLGCLRLVDGLTGLGVPLCRPSALPAGSGTMTARGLAEPCLALLSGRGVVGSDLDPGGCDLVVLTGPNQGGKSTYLRSVGVAHVMLQAGMPVAAREFAAAVARGVHTFWTASEDTSATRGRLVDELARLAAVADRAHPGALLLCNEPFASTDEREGAELATEAARGFTAAGVRTMVVTHLHEFALRVQGERPERTHFLRAQHLPDGGRTFAIVPGPPAVPALGADLYDRIMGAPSPSPSSSSPPSPAHGERRP